MSRDFTMQMNIYNHINNFLSGVNENEKVFPLVTISIFLVLIIILSVNIFDYSTRRKKNWLKGFVCRPARSPSVCQDSRSIDIGNPATFC